MIHTRNPQQTELFDLFESQLSKIAYTRLKKSFHAVFRYIILHLMPVPEIAANFHPVMGRPTKELYSMAGLVLLKEFHNWTMEEAVDAYLFDTRVQYALNLGISHVEFSKRSLQRYQNLLREDEFAQKIFDDVTNHLITELELKVDQQRLDSTHVFSDMAKFGRTKLMGTAISNFLTQLNRHHQNIYDNLPEELLIRYSKKIDILFAEFKNDKDKRSLLRQEVAEEMYQLIKIVDGNKAIENMTTFKTLVTVFNQQCELNADIKVAHMPEENRDSSDSIVTQDNSANTPSNEHNPVDNESLKVIIKKAPGADIIQNPSDLDATYDGHKGQGYQIQLTETCNPENDVQLIISSTPQTAAATDADAIKLVLDDLRMKDILPNELLAATLYGGDDNSEDAKKDGVILVSPVPGKVPQKPPTKITPKSKRLKSRREEQETDEWRTKYKKRAQEEGTIGSIKRKTGMARLRYRGAQKMFAGMLFKTLGWNISRAHKSAKIQQKMTTIFG